MRRCGARRARSYEADLFGRVGRNVEASRADQAQSEALFRSVQLALQADVAQNYFELRQLDSGTCTAARWSCASRH